MAQVSAICEEQVLGLECREMLQSTGQGLTDEGQPFGKGGRSLLSSSMG